MLECRIFITLTHGGLSALTTSTEAYIFTTCMAQVFKAGKPLDEGKEGSLRFIRLREQRTRVHWRPSTLPWATLATRGALEGDALILI